MNDNNDSKTRSFDPVDSSDYKKSQPASTKQKLIMSIFIVIILILVSFAVLIFGQIFSNISSGNDKNEEQNNTQQNFVQVYKDSADVHVGGLLLVNETFAYSYPTENENIVSVYEFKKNSENDAVTKITVGEKSHPTYELGNLATSILLDKTALDMFNQMMLDYCATLDLSGLEANKNASNLNLAWGYSDEETLAEDVSRFGKTFYDHALATTVTLQRNNDSAKISENILKNDYAWLYENCYKYGFVVRYPNASKDKTGLDGSERVHLRYVGYEHAYYMSKNGLCLEEYLELIRTQYTFSGDHLTFTADNGKTYEVYYVASTGNPTGVSVPKDASYSISGDNMNGFVVTITK